MSMTFSRDPSPPPRCSTAQARRNAKLGQMAKDIHIARVNNPRAQLRSGMASAMRSNRRPSMPVLTCQREEPC